jgi:OOP family OmpA-OmpF porin
MHDGVLEAEGFASHPWVVETPRIARLLPGVSQFREDKLLDLERIENPLLMFELDQTQLRPNQEGVLDKLVSDIRRLQQLAGPQNVRLEITGHTDGSGTEALNAPLSQGRADTVADILRKTLPASSNLTIATVGSEEKLREEVTEADRATNRSVTFKVIVSDTH